VDGSEALSGAGWGGAGGLLRAELETARKQTGTWKKKK
jgi:hypothetical protein